MADKPIRIDTAPIITVETADPQGQATHVPLELILYAETEVAQMSQLVIELILKQGAAAAFPIFPEYRRTR